MSKPRIDPIRWQPPPSRPLPAPDFTADLRVVAVPGTAPEDAVADADGNIWTGVEDGRIVRISPDGNSVQVVADKLQADDIAAGIPADCRRSADQYRADALVLISQAVLDGGDLRLVGTGAVPKGRKGRRTRVQVTVALSTLLGLDQQPAELAGYGPIPATVARTLAGDPASTWHRLVHDDLGHLIDYGRSTYRPPQDLIDFVTARDQTCRGPGSQRASRTCDLDHVQDWAHGGATSADNLGPQCRRHHHLKHDCGWHLHRQPDGTYRWISPTGHTYDKPPDPRPEDHTRPKLEPDDDPPF